MKLNLSDLASLTNEATALSTLASNNAALKAAADNTLSRDGSTPNQMETALDMNSHAIINLPAPLSSDEPVRLGDLNTIIGGGTIESIPSGGTTGQALVKTSNTDYAVEWSSSALTKVDDTNVTLTLGGTPAASLLTPASITAGWTGVLGLSRGGLGGSQAAATLNQVPKFDGTKYVPTTLPLSTGHIFNVRDYGAVGDGSTDDTTAIQTAITAANAISGGAVVYFPGGYNYKISDTLSLSVRNNRFIGDGPSSLITQSVVSKTTISMSTWGEIRDLQIFYSSSGTGAGGNQPLTGGIAIVTNIGFAAQSSFINNIMISNAYIGIQSVSGISLTIRDCSIYNSTYAGIMVADGGTPYAIINNIVIQGCTQAALYIYGNCSGTQFIGGNFIDATGWGLLIVPNGSNQAATELFFTGTSFDANVQGNLIIFARDCSFSNCWFSFEYVSGTNASDGLGLIQCGRMFFNGSSFVQNNANGLYLYAATTSSFFSGTSSVNTAITVQGCNCNSNTAVGLNVGANTTDFTFTGNNTSYCGYGIYINTGCDRYSILGNMGTPTLGGGALYGGILVGNGTPGATNSYAEGNY